MWIHNLHIFNKSLNTLLLNADFTERLKAWPLLVAYMPLTSLPSHVPDHQGASTVCSRVLATQPRTILNTEKFWTWKILIVLHRQLDLWPAGGCSWEERQAVNPLRLLCRSLKATAHKTFKITSGSSNKAFWLLFP